jgi:hypothetical protein
VAEHISTRLLVHFGLECETLLDLERALRGRPRFDLVHQPLQMRILRPGIVVGQYEGHKARPSPHIHIDDRVSVCAENLLRIELVMKSRHACSDDRADLTGPQSLGCVL